MTALDLDSTDNPTSIAVTYMRALVEWADTQRVEDDRHPTDVLEDLLDELTSLATHLESVALRSRTAGGPR